MSLDDFRRHVQAVRTVDEEGEDNLELPEGERTLLTD